MSDVILEHSLEVPTTCNEAGCDVVSSDIELIPPGTHIAYTLIGDGSTNMQNAVIAVDNGTTTGVCDFNHDGKPLVAKCTFVTGTGVLTGFHLLADVTLTGKGIDEVWHWDGTYWFGN